MQWNKKDTEYDKRLYNAIKEWVTEAHQWSRVTGDDDDSVYFASLAKITEHFDPEGKHFANQPSTCSYSSTFLINL